MITLDKDLTDLDKDRSQCVRTVHSLIILETVRHRSPTGLHSVPLHAHLEPVNLTLLGSRVFADVIKGGRGHTGLGGPACNDGGPYVMRGIWTQGEGLVKTEADTEIMFPQAQDTRDCQNRQTRGEA